MATSISLVYERLVIRAPTDFLSPAAALAAAVPRSRTTSHVLLALALSRNCLYCLQREFLAHLESCEDGEDIVRTPSSQDVRGIWATKFVAIDTER